MKRRTAKGAASTFAPPAPAGIGGGSQKKAEKFERRLLKYDELPEYLKDNEFIRDYYRCEWPLKDATLSLFCLHNETLNIWTLNLDYLASDWFSNIFGADGDELDGKDDLGTLDLHFFRGG
ncbi:heptahelical transmembrane protein 2 [Striga asiatica]|uniref:Heptahelical transmembrane protein 2 n=1 Tax=Striga asiatica TaxID=4170 RepID=A0A5A7PXR6_STRAF|nr:heptahelical transmembrane protein 2 [Striga asiatica]